MPIYYKKESEEMIASEFIEDGTQSELMHFTSLSKVIVKGNLNEIDSLSNEFNLSITGILSSKNFTEE